MILFDGVIYNLQSSGGISVLFNELLSRLPVNSYDLVVPRLKRPLERYRDFDVRQSYDIFHSTYYRLPSKRDGQIVTTVHDFTYERYSSGLKRKVHSWQKKRAVQGADKIICVSECTRRDLIEFYGAEYEPRVVVVPNGVSEGYFPLAVEVVEQVLFVGARGGYKNFEATVNALSQLSGIGLVCVGGGGFSPGELIFLERKIPGRYKHAGFLSNNELNIEYNRSICLVYPSLYEGFGIPVLEAMRAGCPVIAVNSSSIPEVAGTSAFLVEKGEVTELRDAIRYFYSVDNRQKYIVMGRAQAEKFSWDSTFRQTLSVYNNLLDEKQ
ncbi:glycosyltransferase family 4 protein [Pseudomonas veronii]|uniref:glycosyltransferase family 4 protein n=1 Tax=Pseudomonas veronii TaxID=76761 RepID=UPI00062578E4|nr:glycosyltransferase family 1 protein [Pseudomonas veronii]